MFQLNRTSKLTKSNIFQIAIKATRGTSFRGDIAIDEVTVRSGTCAGKLASHCCMLLKLCGLEFCS